MKQIRYHSQVRIITNSSTELFVIKKPIENIREILVAMIELHNLVNGSNLNYPAVFEELRTYTQKEFQERSRRYPWEYEAVHNIGNTIIEGTYDNSIPFWMYDLIEELGERVERFHLG